MGKKRELVYSVMLLGLCALLLTGCVPETTDPQSLWEGSGHADATSESFVHWDEDGEIPTSCAKCHSTPGFLDFIGADGTASGTVDNPAQIGTVITCEVCHSDATAGTTRSISSVTFPSGLTIENLGSEALCMQCHQGRTSTATVDDAIENLALATDDTVSPDLGFSNIHYYAAAATQYGTFAQGGYQYAGKTYDAKFAHVKGYDTCSSCHDPHSLQIKTDECITCHTGVVTAEALKDIRTQGSLVDYDGDGNTTEGVYYEIADIQTALYSAIQAYGTGISGTAIGYNAASHPYFFIDTNGNGTIDEGEEDRYNAWTPRLLRAAYNYQVSLKDPGAYAHGGKYLIQLLYDSIEDLNAALASPVNIAGFHRADEGHFDGSSEAFRHWDEDGEVQASCSTCHSADGLPNFLTNGEVIAEPLSNGLLCTTCHTDAADLATLRTVPEVTFPSGMTADLGDDSNLCLNCHNGREAKATVDNRIAGSEGPYSFINIHYYPAAAILLGTDAQGGYEYDGKTYAGTSTFTIHGGTFDTCVSCHMATTHNVTELDACVQCHGPVTEMRLSSTQDFDSDGDTTESRKAELEGLAAKLYEEIVAYADARGNPITYDAGSYPYFFADTNGNGIPDGDEGRYENFDAALLKAAFNYQTYKKEPGAYVHNALYIAQIMADSIEDLGGETFSWR